MPLPATIPLPGGLAMPAIGLGTFRSRGQEAADAVGWALAAGYRHIDTASIYKNEEEVGAAIRASGIPREQASQLFITSKVSPYQQGTEAATAACEASLRLLGTYIDLMLVHWPGVAKVDAASPDNAALRRQTWRVLEQFQRQGQLRAIGVSNYELRHLEELLQYAEIKPGVLLRGCGVLPKSVQRQRIEEVAPSRLAECGELSPEGLAALDALEEQQQCKYCWDPSAIA
ncbi:hypothetical protein COHA_003640 [Chlorella ohadii]|uniref:NADP-dependent oxidoreductase domain-containing protein n=1 Tax=Chlorella ohadii TaxID=2649997 RepID=A0AAD5DUL7_9CHLO|nr:hypothetical protein COHA_003640 [Chlorella ohadii]